MAVACAGAGVVIIAAGGAYGHGHGRGKGGCMRYMGLAIMLALLPCGALAAPQALVIGNAAYTSLPPLPACSASAGLIARKLEAAGYQVSQAADLSNGAMDGAISGFFARIAPAGKPAVIYICAYGAALEARDFLLPVTAQIARPTDLLAEGVLARTLLRGGAGHGPILLALDLTRDPAGVLAPATGALAREALPDGTGVAIVTENRPPSAPTAFAGALSEAATAGTLATDRLTALTRTLPDGPVLLVAGVRDAAAPVAAAPSPVAAAPAAPAAMPDEAGMTTAQKKQVQIALATLGYYDGKLDGIFGPDTRAAIRRWQHEKSRPMTGQLTGADAGVLVGAGH
jgi:hypothetical protein